MWVSIMGCLTQPHGRNICGINMQVVLVSDVGPGPA